MKTFIHWNGALLPADELSISPDNRGLRYGDGIFETMKADGGIIRLAALHFKRLFDSLALLQFELPSSFTADYLQEQIRALLVKNQHDSLTRVRLMVCRDSAGSHGSPAGDPCVLIQSWPLRQPENKRLQIDVFPHARKACDLFSAIKSNNYLPYLMGAIFAEKNGLNDAVILNSYGRLADATIANIFIVKHGLIKTPPLTEGCVNGVFRRYLLDSFEKDGIRFSESPIDTDAFFEADEIFLTNAISGIRSVARCGSSAYVDEISAKLRDKYNF